VAFGFIGFGIFTIFSGNLMNGLWLAFIGWFLQNAAASTYAQSTMQSLLRGMRVEQVMARECTRVTSLTPLSTLVEERVLNGGERCFFVADNGKLYGMLTLRDISAIPQARWGFTTTRQAMVPYERLVHVAPRTELIAALKIMDDHNIAQVPVVENDELVGMLSREQVVHYLRSRAELGI
jgi:CBS domain-containing protein